MSSITNSFTQDLVLSEQLLRANSLKYATVFANRSTKLLIVRHKVSGEIKGRDAV
jgi:hypothetical protein